jgi:hypothetical protein
MENDAVGCYDRMVNNLLLLELRRRGLPQAIIEALAQTWAQSIHRIQTAFGVSEATYSNTVNHAIWSWAGIHPWPILWLLLLTLIVINPP